MAVYDHQEQEQLDELKAWWQQHGNWLTNILLAIALVALAWQGWNYWQRKQTAEAAGLYGALQMAVAKQDSKAVRDLTGELIDKYPRTPYAVMGVLVGAKAQIEGNDAKTARMQLTWAADNAKDDALRDLARLRLASLLLDEKAYDEALALMNKESLPSFAARFLEIKGDILVAQGKEEDAKAAYLQALTKEQELQKAVGSGPDKQRSAYAEVLKIKLESVGGKAPEEAPADAAKSDAAKADAPKPDAAKAAAGAKQ